LGKEKTPERRYAVENASISKNLLEPASPRESPEKEKKERVGNGTGESNRSNLGEKTDKDAGHDSRNLKSPRPAFPDTEFEVEGKVFSRKLSRPESAARRRTCQTLELGNDWRSREKNPPEKLSTTLCSTAKVRSAKILRHCVGAREEVSCSIRIQLFGSPVSIWEIVPHDNHLVSEPAQLGSGETEAWLRFKCSCRSIPSQIVEGRREDWLTDGRGKKVQHQFGASHRVTRVARHNKRREEKRGGKALSEVAAERTCRLVSLLAVIGNNRHVELNVTEHQLKNEALRRRKETYGKPGV